VADGYGAFLLKSKLIARLGLQTIEVQAKGNRSRTGSQAGCIKEKLDGHETFPTRSGGRAGR
jgi:hypothetical protein